MTGGLSGSLVSAPKSTETADGELGEERIHYGDGRFQRMALACASIAAITFSCHSLGFKLATLEMDHWCKPPKGLGNLTVSEWKNAAIPVEEDGGYSRCTMYDPPLDHLGNASRRIIACDAWDFDLEKFDSSIVSQWNLVCHRYYMLRVARLVTISGSVFSMPLMGIAADHYGRQPIASVCAFVLLVTAFASSMPNYYAFFVAVRSAVAASSASLMIILYCHLYEVTSATRRTLFCFVGAGLTIVVVPVVFIVLASLGLDWMGIQLVLMAPTTLLLFVFFLVWESPEWLAVNFRLNEAQQVAVEAARMNLASQGEAKASVAKAVAALQKKRVTDELPLQAAVRDILFTPSRRRNTVNLLFCWFAVDFSYYAVSLNTPVTYHSWAKIGFLLLAFPVYIAMYFGLLRFGRRNVSVTSAMGISSVAALIATFYDDEASHLTSALVMVVKMLTNVTFGTVSLFTAGVFATAIRCTGICSSFAVGRLAAMLAVALVEFRSTIPPYLVLYCVSALTASCAVALTFVAEMNTSTPVLWIATKGVNSRHDMVASLSPSPVRSKEPQKKTKRKAAPGCSAVRPPCNLPASGL